MQHEAQVAKEGGIVPICGGELVIVRDHEGVRRDRAVFAAQIANLAGLREAGIAGRVFAAEERIQVSARSGAVAVTRNRVGMDVVDHRQVSVIVVISFSNRSLTRLTERATLLWWQVAELDLEPDTDAVGVGGGGDVTLDVASVGKGRGVEGGIRESGGVVDSGRVADHDGGIAQLLCSRLVC